ncbi:hypothetical protein FOCC_FOCC011531 [Frankliniella occidentalis]|nr:hypothetical protein FOCC_FOCC011531 [Frankliniella occidentalis]
MLVEVTAVTTIVPHVHTSLHRYLCPAIDSTIMGRQWNWTGNRDRDAEHEFSLVLKARQHWRILKILQEKKRLAEIKFKLLQELLEVRNSIAMCTKQKLELLFRQSELLVELTDVTDRNYELGLEVLNLKKTTTKVQEEIMKLKFREVHLLSQINSVNKH